MDQTSIRLTHLLELEAQGLPSPQQDEDPADDRQSRLKWWDQELMSEASVGIVGCGGAGSPIAYMFSRMGVGALHLWDGDVCELSNISRQYMFQKDIGKNKAWAVARNISRACINSTMIRAYSLHFQEAMEIYPDCFEDVDIIFSVTDDDRSRRDLSELGLESRKPVIMAAVSETGLHGLIFVQEEGGPCFECVRPLDERARTEAEQEIETRCEPLPSAIFPLYTAACYAVFAGISLMMGREQRVNWHEFYYESTSRPLMLQRREDCKICSKFH